MSLINGIFLRARIDPHKPAIFLPDRVVTYGMIGAGIISAERQIKQLEIGPNQWVALNVDNPARHLILLLALWRMGVPSASIRPDLVASAIAHGCRLLFSETAPNSSSEMARQARHVVVTDDWFTHPVSEPGSFAETFFAPLDACRISFTSGSTGLPKPVVHTEIAYQRRVFDTLLTAFHRPWTRLLIMGGLSIGFGPAQALQALWLGRTVCFARSPDEAIRMISHYCIEAVMGSPMRILEFVERQEQTQIPLPSLTSIQFGGASMGFSGLLRIRSRFAADLLEEYASTEASIAGIANSELLKLRRMEPAVFAPVLKVEITRDGLPVPDGQEGEVRIKSPSLGMPLTDDLKCPLHDGWFYPGDRGVLRKDGLFMILGRSDNVINAGGVKINPESVEEQLARNPRIKDVAVLGGMLEDRVHIRAIVVPTAPCTPSDIISWIEKNSPTALVDEILFADIIPRTQSGKIARDTLAGVWGSDAAHRNKND